MGLLSTQAATLLSTTSTIDMKTAASTTLYTVPTGKTLRILFVLIRDISASLAGGTSYSVTSFGAAFSLANVTGGGGTAYTVVPVTANAASYAEIAAGATVSFTVTTGSTAACTATIDLFGVLS